MTSCPTAVTSQAQQLSQDLEMQRQEDVQRMRKSISSAMKMANEDGVWGA